jgi:DNA-binding MarR family transcriptional regulator
VGDVLKRRIKQDRFESPLQEAVLNLLVAAGYVQERMDRVCAEHGITGVQYNVLRILRGAHPGGHSRSDVAVRLVDRAPDVTRLLDRLEAQGYVERSRSGADKRHSISTITAAGIALLERMDPAVRATHERLAKRISPRDRRELSRICEGLYGDDVA